jgi:hypothetical protein
MAKIDKDCASLFVGARLAGEGNLKGAFAGKPGSYRSGFFSIDQRSRKRPPDQERKAELRWFSPDA